MPETPTSGTKVSAAAGREEKGKGREEGMGRDRPSKPKNEKSPGGLSARKRHPFFLFFLHDTDTRVPPIGETH